MATHSCELEGRTACYSPWTDALSPVPVQHILAMGCAASSDLTVDGEELAAQRTNIDPQETADLDVYVSTLSSPVASGLVVVQELGLITGTFMRAKMRNQMVRQAASKS